ncbi:MAG: PAQR family membrane homeostasis protein TrhA [Bdellovibrionota bacterium]
MYEGERLNSHTHLAGGLLTLLGICLLLAKALSTGNPAMVIGFSIYGAATLGMFVSSTAYHSVSGPRKVFLRKIDHVAIFVMTAGTYTPFCLGPLRSDIGTPLLLAVWGLAMLGLVLEFTLAQRTRAPSLLLYFAMSFLSIATFPGLERALGTAAVFWIKGGFALYAVGFLFYALDKKFRRRHLHGVWHLFVIAAAFCHYVCMYEFVLKRP